MGDRRAAMIEFRIRQWDKTGEFVSDAMMGPNSLRMEIEHMPVGWKMEVVRIARDDGNGNPVEGLNSDARGQ